MGTFREVVMEKLSAALLTEEERKAQELLEEKEPDSKLREFTGPLAHITTILFLIWSAFQIYANTFGSIDVISLRTWHLLALLGFTFLLFPTYPTEKRVRSFPRLGYCPDIHPFPDLCLSGNKLHHNSETWGVFNALRSSNCSDNTCPSF